MRFQTKDFVSIVASMVNYMRASQDQITDFNVGSVVRTLVEAPAGEIDQLYQQMLIGLRDAIPVSVFEGFGFAALAASPASGLVRFTITSQASDVTIPAGTRLTREGDNLAYSTIAAATIAAGDTTADVRAVCDTAGITGNAGSGTDFYPSPAPTGFLTAVALGAFSNGRDAETEDQRALRFQSFIASLPRGTIAAIRYGLSLVQITDAAGTVTERVVLSNIVEPWVADNTQPVGWFEVYIHNGSGSTSADLVALAAKVLAGYQELDGTWVPGWKAAGVKCDVIAADDLTQAVTATVTVASGYVAADVQADVQAAMTAYITALGIGQTLIRAELIAAAMEVAGVTDITMATPAANVTATKSQKIVPGTFTLS